MAFNQEDWWQKEKDAGDQTTEALDAFHMAVSEKLNGIGIHGHTLGKPTICNATLVNICVLDPQNEVPQTLELFTEGVGTFVRGEEFNPTMSDSFSYIYNPQDDDYVFSFKDGSKEFDGKCNKAGDIVTIDEVPISKSE